MAPNSFSTTILVNNSPAEAFNAINKVGDWWQGEVIGNSHLLHDVFEYKMEDIHYSKQQVVEFVPNQKIVWLVTESKLNFTNNKGEWTNSKLIFEITTINNKTQVKFTHQGLITAMECYNDCSNAWSQLIQISLLSLITTGKGKKVF